MKLEMFEACETACEKVMVVAFLILAGLFLGFLVGAALML